MKASNTGRRALLAALVVWAFASALPAAAQDPMITEAQRTALDWLSVVDADNATASYAAAAAKFRNAMTPEQWAGAMTQARTQFGAFQRRTFAGAQMPEEGPNRPQGEFVMVIFRSGFEKRETVVETVTLERESDRKWRVVGYSLK